MNTSKKSIQAAAVKTVKAVMCVPHLVLQTATDLTNATEATAINLIDGTPVDQSMMDRALYTNAKQQAALNKIEELKAKINEQKERIRAKKIELLKAQLNKAEGVEQISEQTTEPIQTITVPTPPAAPAPPVMTAPMMTPEPPMVTPPAAPAPPKARTTRAKKEAQSV